MTSSPTRRSPGATVSSSPPSDRASATTCVRTSLAASVRMDPDAASFAATSVSGVAGVIVLVAGIGVVVFAADVFVDGLLGVALALGIAPFVLSVALSGFETENLATGIAANAKGLPGAAAGTFLGGVTFLAFGVAGLGGLIAPIRVELPTRFAVWTAVAPLPLLACAIDGHISRIEGGLLVVWSVVALVGLARSGREMLAAEDDDERVRRPGAPAAGRARPADRRGMADRPGSPNHGASARHPADAARKHRAGRHDRGRGARPLRGPRAARATRDRPRKHRGNNRSLRGAQRRHHRARQAADARDADDPLLPAGSGRQPGDPRRRCSSSASDSGGPRAPR